MAVFPCGYIWPSAGTGVGKAQTTPAAQSLTAAYVASSFTFEVNEKSRLFCNASLAVGAVEDPALLVRVDLSWDGGTTWFPGYKVIAVPALTVGNHGFFINLPDNWHGATWRIACRDMLADADTAITVYAEAMVRGADNVSHCVEDQPIELATAMIEGVIAYHNAGAAVAMDAALTQHGSWIPVGRANEAEIWLTTDTGPPTAVEFRVDQTLDGGASQAPIPAINSILVGTINEMPGVIQFQSAAGTLANGTYMSHRIPVQPGSWIRLYGRRVGAAVNGLAYVRLYRV